MSEELKPCPFCGAQPEQWEEEPDRMWWPYFVGCTNVDCLCDVCVQRGSEEEAVADWNRRYERTCHVNEVDALTQTLSMANGCSWGECSECGCITPMGSVFCIQCGARVERGE